VNWEERTIDDSFQDASNFAIDLAVSLEERLENCIADGVKEATFFDIEDTVTVLSGQRLENGQVILREGDLEEHGASSFKTLFSEICSFPSVKKLDDPRFDPKMSLSVLHDWKKSLRKLVWGKDMVQDLLSCLEPIEENETEGSLLTDPKTSLLKLEPVQVDARKMETRKAFKFEFATTSHLKRM
jgi:hypothetical protein